MIGNGRATTHSSRRLSFRHARNVRSDSAFGHRKYTGFRIFHANPEYGNKTPFKV
jgi:hypothetical protein